MRIIDPVKNSIGLGYNSTRDTIGIVFKTSEMLDGKPYLGLIIPKFMLGYSFKSGDKPKDVSYAIKNDKCINDPDEEQFWDSSATIKNYIIVRPLLNQNQSMPTYTQGDKVFITMVDDDIKTMAFLPYGVNRLGQRKTDSLLYSVPANPEENTAMTEDNAYIIKLDSTDKNQTIIIQTSDKNGEACKHTFEFNSKEGTATITDNQDRSWVMDTQNDSVTTKTSGSTIEQVGDKVNITCDTCNIKADSKIYMKTDTLEIDSQTIKSKSNETTYDYDNFKQTSTNGTFNVDKEDHSGMSFGIKANTFHSNCPINGLNGLIVFPSFQVGAIPDVTALPSPVNGMSGPQGMMSMSTDPAGVPLAKFPQLQACLKAIAAAADMYPSGAGAASAAVAAWGALGKTTKIKSS